MNNYLLSTYSCDMMDTQSCCVLLLCVVAHSCTCHNKYLSALVDGSASVTHSMMKMHTIWFGDYMECESCLQTK